MKLNIKGNTAVIKGLETYKRRVESKVKTHFKDWATDTEQMAKARAPTQTGALKNSIHADTENNGWVWTVGTPVNYAPYVEFGTGVLVDVPQGLEDYAIQFKGKGIKQVNLPARPYLFNSARENFNKLIEKLKKDFG